MTDAEAFLVHLERVFGTPPEIDMVTPTSAAQPGVGCLYFRDVPEPGFLTAVTYGLSSAIHSDWRYGKPELMISLLTRDMTWGRAIAHLVERHRSEWSFSYGQTINFHQRVSLESTMSAFFIFAPSILEREAYLGIQLPSTVVNIAGIYPMYEGEIALLRAIGFERFWRLPGLDIYSVTRPDLSGDPANWLAAKPDT